MCMCMLHVQHVHVHVHACACYMLYMFRHTYLCYINYTIVHVHFLFSLFTDHRGILALCLSHRSQRYTSRFIFTRDLRDIRHHSSRTCVVTCQRYEIRQAEVRLHTDCVARGE